MRDCAEWKHAALQVPAPAGTPNRCRKRAAAGKRIGDGARPGRYDGAKAGAAAAPGQGRHVATAPLACAPKRRADRSAAGRREALARRSGSTGTLPRARALLPLLRLLCAAPSSDPVGVAFNHASSSRPRPAPWPAGRACRAMWFLAVFTHRTPTPALRPREE